MRTRDSLTAILLCLVGACSDDASTPAPDSGMAGTDAGPREDAGATPPDAGAPTAASVRDLVQAYAAAHPGRAGDVNALSPAEVAMDPDAQRLLALCGDDQRPVIPLLAWEYGGADHAWIGPDGSPLVICVYVPVVPSTEHWAHDGVVDHVTADTYVLFPDDNPCGDRVGAETVSGCIGDPSNFEILVDTASYRDGLDVGLSLSEASTELRLILADGSEVHLFDGL